MASVLIIEDDKTIRGGLQRLLSNEGLETFFADNGRDGIKLAEAHSPSLIICDIAMPEVDGYQVLASIRSNPKFVKTPFLFLSAKITADDEKRGLAAGANAYLKKPMWPDDIIEVIKKFL